MKTKDIAGSDRPSLYAQVTDRIIAELEAGLLPWVQPWDRAKACAGLPRNAGTGRAYSGINILILWAAVIEHGYGGQAWLTYRQCEALGGHVRKGESGTTICYADRFTPKSEQERAVPVGEEVRQVAFLKRFTVFHELGHNAASRIMPSGEPRRAEHVGPAFRAFGIILMPLPDRSARSPQGRVGRATRKLVIFRVLRSAPFDWRRRAQKIMRDPLASFAKIMPNADPPELEKSASLHLSIGIIRDSALWPLCRIRHNGHWTGHVSRLARDQSGRFGDAFYAREELVADMASAFVCAEMSIQPTVRHADYIGSWLAVLREDPKAIFRAASQASKAADLLLGFGGGDARSTGEAA